MTKEKLALSDFFKTQTVVFASGVENKQEHDKDSTDLPICRSCVKVSAKSIKLVKARKASAK